MIINHNIAALNTYRQLSSNQTLGSKSLEKLSAGLRINRAGDDAAGLAISEKMRGQIRGLTQASRNAQDGISLIQTAEGALNETHSILQRMRELAVQASNDTNTDEDRLEIQKELNQLTSEINRIGNTTEFNTKNIINGEMGISGGGGTTAGTAASCKIDFTDVTLAEQDDVSFKLTIDGTEYTIEITGDDSDPVKATKVTVTADGGVNEEADVESGDTIATALATAFGQIDGLEDDFSFTASGNILTIKAEAAGKQADLFEVTDNDSVLVEEVVIVEGADSTPTSGPGSDGSAKIQVGANQGQQFTISINDMRAQALGIAGTDAGAAATSGENEGASFAAEESDEESNALTDTSGDDPEYALDITDADKATSAVTVIQKAIQTVSAERSKLGAYQNRLEHTINNLGTSAENLTAAESRVRDVDMASEMMEFTKMSIMQQAATAMLAQANQQPQQVLQLLR